MRNVTEQQRIQRMQPFNDKGLIAVQLQRSEAFLTLPGKEVEARKRYFFSVYKQGQIPAEPCGIYGVDMFKVDLTVFITLDKIPVDLVIVQREHDRIQPGCAQLGRYAVSGCSLAR